MKGRKPIPTETKVLRGTFRNDRANPDEPEVSPVLPVPPPDLDPEEREAFGRLVDRLEAENRASSSHTEIITMLARRLVEIDRLSADIRSTGLTCVSVNADTGITMRRANPSVTLRSEALRHAHSLLSELGLTPTSVSKASAPKSGKKPATGFGALG